MTDRRRTSQPAGKDPLTSGSRGRPGRSRGGGEWVRPGALALDSATGRVGEVRQVGPTYSTGSAAKKDRDTVWLRPCDGGLEWEANAADLSPAESGLQGAA